MLRTPFSISYRAISRKFAVKHPKRLGVAIRADGHPMVATADIDTSRIRVHDF
jgi:hypothetical protein